jgi:hypothetical protein
MKKHLLIILLTVLIPCGSVIANPAIDALERQIEELQKEPKIEDFEKFWKLNDILKSMKRQEKSNQAIQEWMKSQEQEVCTSLDRNTLMWSDCEKVRI